LQDLRFHSLVGNSSLVGCSVASLVNTVFTFVGAFCLHLEDGNRKCWVFFDCPEDLKVGATSYYKALVPL
jgi:hypothetical protein